MAESVSSAIYDLGYERYQGPRLGRRHAIWALYTESLRAIFGLGRSGWAKVTAFGILAIVLMPAVAQLAIAALASGDVEVFRHEDYYRIIEPMLAIFCAMVAPDLLGRDQRTRTLSLYFSRALRREDYAFARYAAFATSFLSLTILPQMLMFVGNASASRDTLDYTWDNWDNIPAIFASGALLSCLVAAIGLAVAARTPRRAYATVAIVAAFLLTLVISGAVFEAAGDTNGRYALLFAPFFIVRGSTFWIFGVDPQGGFRDADLYGGIYVMAAVVMTLLCLASIIQRYRNIEA